MPETVTPRYPVPPKTERDAILARAQQIREEFSRLEQIADQAETVAVSVENATNVASLKPILAGVVRNIGYLSRDIGYLARQVAGDPR